MEYLSLSLDSIFIIVILTLSLLILIGIWFYRKIKTLQQVNSKLLNQLQTKMERKLQLEGIKLLTRIKVVEDKILLSHNKIADMEQKTYSKSSYNQAAKMVKMGATVDDVIESCGISKAEAELLITLKRKE